jgi:hypothetical protein
MKNSCGCLPEGKAFSNDATPSNDATFLIGSSLRKSRRRQIRFVNANYLFWDPKQRIDLGCAMHFTASAQSPMLGLIFPWEVGIPALPEISFAFDSLCELGGLVNETGSFLLITVKYRILSRRESWPG